LGIGPSEETLLLLGRRQKMTTGLAFPHLANART
jgi:hypothetical protein